MNKKVYIIGSLIVATLLVGLGLNQIRKQNLGFYKTYALNFHNDGMGEEEEEHAGEALEWLKARYVDVQTGQQVTDEKLKEIRKRISQMDRSKNISFTEEGPDNIGGRTRAIQVDRTNINRVWAGGVSGGLFVSLNKGNLWNRR